MGGRLSSSAAAFLTFTAAACVLVLEIGAGRLLAPYVGVSLMTYTGIIGVILAGIAAGAWAGGRAADAFGPERLLGPTMLLGGCAAIAAVPIVALVGPAAVTPDSARIVLLATVGFFAPAAILSAVGPMIVRATLVDLGSSGSLVGRLSAVGTLGAITGTFLTGFVLLGLFPTGYLIVGTGALLVVVGTGVTWRVGRSSRVAVLGIIVTLMLAPVAVATPEACDLESRYYCIEIVEDASNAGGRTLVLDGLSHAYVDVADPSYLRFSYVRRFADVAAGPIDARAGVATVLHIGGGGFSFPRYLLTRFPATRHTVLELDPTVVAVNRAKLGLRPSPAMEIVIGDARRSIQGLESDAFDLAFGDAFGGLAVPWHLTTREFLAEVDRVLTPDGLYAMNLIDYPPLDFVRAEVATARTIFRHVAVIADPPTLHGRSGGNVVLVASHQRLDVDDIRSRIGEGGEASAAAVLEGDETLMAFIAGAPVLTDDYAPVDQLVAR